MITIADYSDPFQSILDFEREVAKFTGAPYCITTDCCSHAIEIAFRLRHDGGAISFPARTYLSVLMTMQQLKIPYILLDKEWRGFYQFEGTDIWDYAREFSPGMYQPGTIQCVSFGTTKPLQIGRGGCILTDDADLYAEASRMRYDGRDVFGYSPWVKQKRFKIGYHYYLRPEECITGLNLLAEKKFTEQIESYYDRYPDCREIIIDE